MYAFTRVIFLAAVWLTLSAAEGRAVIKAPAALQQFVRDSTQIVRVKVTRFDPDNRRMVLAVEQDIHAKLEGRTLNVVWKVETDSKWEGVRALPQVLKAFGPDQEAVLFINDRGGFWHNKGAERKNPIAFGFTDGSWFCLESTRRDDGTLVWRLAQGEPYLRTTFRGTTAELTRVLVDHLAGRGKLPEPARAEPGFGPEYRPKK